MTFPQNLNAYLIASGNGSLLAPIFEPFDPTPNNITGPSGPLQIQQKWVNTLTQAIWVFEQYLCSNGIVTAQWRAIAPIVLMPRDPTAADYLYPLGQTWLNTSLSTYWVLEEVIGMTATWTPLTSEFAGPILSIADCIGTKSYPDATGNFQLANGDNINTIAGSHLTTIMVSGTTDHAVQVGNVRGSLTSLPLGSQYQVLQSSGPTADPAWSTATYPPTVVANEILYASATNVVGQIPTIDNGVLITSPSGAPEFLAPVVDGVMLSDNTGAPFWLPNSSTAGYVLTSNTAAPPSWGPSGPAFTSINIQVFTSSGTYTPTMNMQYCIIEIVGGGGSGGGAKASSGTATQCAAGGSGAEYARGVFSAATIGASQTVTIGAAGTPGNGSGGMSGTTTSVGALISAFGGIGGGVCPSGPTTVTYATGVSGGTGGSGGNFRVSGGYSSAIYANGSLGAIFFGYGGSSAFSSGAQDATQYSPSAPYTQPGYAATGYGGGGGGSANVGSSSTVMGGAGSAGVAIITEYIS